MNSLRKNIVYNTIYQVLILIVPLITAPYVSRVLLSEGLGTYGITTAIARYFWLFALLGMSNYANRAIAQARDTREGLSDTFWNLISFQAITSGTMLLLYLAFLLASGWKTYGFAALCQLPYVAAALFEVSWFFYGTEQFGFMVARNGIIKILTAAAVFLFVREHGDVWIYVLINALSLLIGQICLWPFILKKVDWVRPQWDKIKKHFKPNLILFVSVLAVSIYTLMDKIMIEIMSTRSQVGYYENTEKLLNICVSVVGAIGTVMLPRISYMMGNKDKSGVLDYLAKSMKYIMIFALALSLGLAGVAKEFAVVYFGEEFRACGIMIAVIAFAVIFYAWENILRTHYLLPGGRDAIFVKGTVCAALANLLLNLLFIPRFQALGAVIGTVGAQIAEAAYQTVCIRKELPIREYIRSLLPAAGAGILMCAYCRLIGILMGPTIWTLVIQVAGGAILYLILTVFCYDRAGDELVQHFLHKIKERIH